MTPINRTEFVSALVERIPSLTEADARLAVNLILDSLVRALARGQRVEIRGFGSFNLTRHEACVRRNPKNNELIQVAAKHAVRFRPAKQMRENVDAAKAAEDEEKDKA